MPTHELSGTTALVTGTHPRTVGTAIIDIATGSADDRDAYPLTATGLSLLQ